MKLDEFMDAIDDRPEQIIEAVNRMESDDDCNAPGHVLDALKVFVEQVHLLEQWENKTTNAWHTIWEFIRDRDMAEQTAIDEESERRAVRRYGMVG